jgi:hypothetical protein
MVARMFAVPDEGAALHWIGAVVVATAIIAIDSAAHELIGSGAFDLAGSFDQG